MDEEETKSCPNCKREIPAVNFMIHSVHCARNIKVCPVCKEPVPGAELDDHHKKMHKLLPCKKCGESVCGSDLEDHIRDSCAHTVKSCRFCELELPRRDLPTHEGYCGVRTEQCPDCNEYVMIKYQQLHLDSNHGFIRLDDDPAPPKREPPKLRPVYKSNLNNPNTSSINSPKTDNIQRPTSIFDDFNRPTSSDNRRTSSDNRRTSSDNRRTSSHSGQDNQTPNHVRNRPSSSNPGLNSALESPRNMKPSSSTSGPSQNSALSSSDRSHTKPDSSNYGLISSNSGSPTNSGLASSNTRPSSFNPRPDLGISGLIFANPLPVSSSHSEGSPSKPGSSNTRQDSTNSESSSSNIRPSNFDIAGQSRILNTNNIRNVKEVNQGPSNIAVSPTNISPQETMASVVRANNGVKKRTNDQPQINMDTSATKTVDKDLGAVSRGAVKKRPAPQPPRASSRRELPYYSAMQRHQREEREMREKNDYNLAHGLPPVLNPAQKIEKLRKMDALQNRDFEEEYRSRQRRPSPEHTYAGQASGYQDLDEANRQQFKNLKPMSPSQFMRRFSSLQVDPASSPADRFPEIKSSLRELRRGLNEVTAPYNANNNVTANNNNDRVRSPGPHEVRLPCEFCGMLVPAEDLVQHQTGCRPDLAQLVPGAAAPPPAPAASRSRPPASPSPPAHSPVIPCEFCMQSLPVYLIIEHQERCIQGNMPV